MKAQLLIPSCNVETVRDGRGGIFTWVPQDKIAEFNLLYFTPGATRGHHYHPEFTEYFLVVDGSGVFVSRESAESKEEVIHLSRGSCVRVPQGTSHTIYAINNMTAIAMITKPWDDCNPPIEHVEFLKGKK